VQADLAYTTHTRESMVPTNKSCTVKMHIALTASRIQSALLVHTSYKVSAHTLDCDILQLAR
jgi:hypothetical protein